VQIYAGSISEFASKKRMVLRPLFSVPVSPSMRTLDPVCATVRTRAGIFVRSVLYLNLPSNSRCWAEVSVGKSHAKQLSASGKAMFDRPLLASYAVSAIRSHDTPKISGTL
jgi:hypothetical protein